MWQVLVKTTPSMVGSYSYMFDTPEERDDFVERKDVWWYYFPEEDDSFGNDVSWANPGSASSGWRRGGAQRETPIGTTQGRGIPSASELRGAMMDLHQAAVESLEEDDRW